MPEAEEVNRTEDGKIVQVQSNVASANKGAVRANNGKGNMLLVRARAAYADECCMFGKLLQIMWTAKRQLKSGNSNHYKRKS